MAELSILINCKNGSYYLKKAIQSILVQDFNDYDILFIDNCSTDNSIEIANSFNDKRIKVIPTEENMTLGQARSYGMKYIDSNLLCFLDVDDRMHKNRLKNQLELIKSGNYGICYGACNLINSNEKKIGKININDEKGFLLEKLLIDGKVPFCSSMIDVNKNHKEIYFSEEFKYSPDLEFLARILINSEGIASSKVFTNYMVRNDSLTADTIKYAHEERLLLIENIKNKIDNELLLKYKKKADRTILLSSILNKNLSSKKLIKIFKKENYKKKMIFLLTLFHLLPFKFKNRLINTIKYKISLLFMFRF